MWAQSPQHQYVIAIDAALVEPINGSVESQDSVIGDVQILIPALVLVHRIKMAVSMTKRVDFTQQRDVFHHRDASGNQGAARTCHIVYNPDRGLVLDIDSCGQTQINLV